MCARRRFRPRPRLCYFSHVREASATTARAPGVLGAALGGLALAFALLGGCGADRPPIEGSGARSGGAAAGGELEFAHDAGSTKPPGCGSMPDGSQCECLDVPMFLDPPTIYFVLDRSGSMLDKWTQVRVTVGKIMRSLGPRASFGAAMFPGRSADDACAPGEEILSVRPGDPPSSGVDGPTTTALLTATRVAPNGGTPTAPTLEAVKNTLSTVGGEAFVILATDGAPNCNENASCGFDQCQPNIEDMGGCPKEGPKNCCEPPVGFPENCNDTGPTLTAIGALKSAGIPVYVVGLPGAAPYVSLLDAMAVAGGTALPSSPKYFAVDSASEDVMLKTLRKIAAQITGSCVFELKEAPAEPSLVNVYLDEVILPFEPTNGWTLDGKTVTLAGAACERVKNGDVLDVRIITGCPRLEPK